MGLTTRNIFKSRKIIILAIIIVILIIGAIIAKPKKQPEYTLFEVKKGTLVQSVDATGKIESADRIELNFKTTGRIARIYVKIGDKVAAGQKLAELEAGDLFNRVKQAQANLSQVKADYEKLMAGASTEDIRVTTDTVNQKTQDVLSAQNDLDNLKNKSQTALANLKETLITVIKNEFTKAEGAMEEVENTLSDNDAQATLSVKNQGALTIAEINQTNANETLTGLEDEINLLNLATTEQSLLALVEKIQAALSKVSGVLSNTLNVLSATLSSSTLTETELDTLKTNIKTQQTYIATSKTNLQTAKSNLTNTTADYNEQIKTAENAVLSAQRALDVAQAQLELKKSPPRQFEIDSQKARVASAQAEVDLAYANLNEAIIFAPLNGTITQKNFEVGEQSSLNQPVLEMIGESNLQIEVDIAESDIAKISFGQEAAITLDALGDETVLKGKVTFINPAETIIQDVVYYQVKIQLMDKKPMNLTTEVKPGMTANVTLYTGSKEDVLFVPARAVKTNTGDKYVDVLINKTPEKRVVTTGMRGNDGIEILSGLNVGDQVITFTKK